MKGLGAIKESAGRLLLRRLRRDPKKRVRTMRLDQAQRLGLVFKAETEEECRVVAAYVRQLREEGIRNIKAIGQVVHKEQPDFLPEQKEFLYFGRKDIAWTGKPQGKAVSTFIQQEFDLLVDLSGPFSNPLGFIVAWSKAGMKVGGDYDHGHPFLDLMIKVGPEKDTKKLIKGLNQYLRNLQPIKT